VLLAQDNKLNTLTNRSSIKLGRRSSKTSPSKKQIKLNKAEKMAQAKAELEMKLAAEKSAVTKVTLHHINQKQSLDYMDAHRLTYSREFIEN
jgi:hypothetical protein